MSAHEYTHYFQQPPEFSQTDLRDALLFKDGQELGTGCNDFVRDMTVTDCNGDVLGFEGLLIKKNRDIANSILDRHPNGTTGFIFGESAGQSYTAAALGSLTKTCLELGIAPSFSEGEENSVTECDQMGTFLYQVHRNMYGIHYMEHNRVIVHVKGEKECRAVTPEAFVNMSSNKELKPVVQVKASRVLVDETPEASKVDRATLVKHAVTIGEYRLPTQIKVDKKIFEWCPNLQKKLSQYQAILKPPQIDREKARLVRSPIQKKSQYSYDESTRSSAACSIESQNLQAPTQWSFKSTDGAFTAVAIETPLSKNRKYANHLKKLATEKCKLAQIQGRFNRTALCSDARKEVYSNSSEQLVIMRHKTLASQKAADHFEKRMASVIPRNCQWRKTMLLQLPLVGAIRINDFQRADGSHVFVTAPVDKSKLPGKTLMDKIRSALFETGNKDILMSASTDSTWVVPEILVRTPDRKALGRGAHDNQAVTSLHTENFKWGPLYELKDKQGIQASNTNLESTEAPTAEMDTLKVTPRQMETSGNNYASPVASHDIKGLTGANAEDQYLHQITHILKTRTWQKTRLSGRNTQEVAPVEPARWSEKWGCNYRATQADVRALIDERHAQLFKVQQLESEKIKMEQPKRTDEPEPRTKMEKIQNANPQLSGAAPLFHQNMTPERIAASKGMVIKSHKSVSVDSPAKKGKRTFELWFSKAWKRKELNDSKGSPTDTSPLLPASGFTPAADEGSRVGVSISRRSEDGRKIVPIKRQRNR